MTIVDDAEFVRWAESAPAVLRTDPLWSLNAYRVSIYLLDRAKADVATIRRARRLHRDVGDQLLRSVSSISANISEGLGRPTSLDRQRFMSIALGSLRESLTWYLTAAEALPPALLDRRLSHLGELRSLLLGYISWLNSQDKKGRLI